MRNQIEDNVISDGQPRAEGAGDIRPEERHEPGRVQLSDPGLPAFPEVPDVVIDLIDRPDMGPLGVG